jgi:hypothetical protein
MNLILKDACTKDRVFADETSKITNNKNGAADDVDNNTTGRSRGTLEGEDNGKSLDSDSISSGLLRSLGELSIGRLLAVSGMLLEAFIVARKVRGERRGDVMRGLCCWRKFVVASGIALLLLRFVKVCMAVGHAELAIVSSRGVNQCKKTFAMSSLFIRSLLLILPPERGFDQSRARI